MSELQRGQSKETKKKQKQNKTKKTSGDGKGQRTDVVGGPAGRAQGRVVVDDFGQPEIGEHDMVRRLAAAEEQVFRLEVAVHDPALVQVSAGRRGAQGGG